MKNGKIFFVKKLDKSNNLIDKLVKSNFCAAKFAFPFWRVCVP